MIKAQDIKPCGGLSTVVIVEEGESTPSSPAPHKSTHAIGGSDPLTPADIGAATAAQGVLAASAVQPNTPASFSSVHAGAAPAFLTPHLTFGSTSNGFSSGDGVRSDLISGGTQVAFWHRDQGFFFFRLVSASRLACNPFTSSPDPVLEQEAAGLFAVTNGFGSYRDIKVRDLIATQYLRPASYTAAAANALISPPDGAIIHVSNEAGGACNAYRARGAWRRTYDDAPIS